MTHYVSTERTKKFNSLVLNIRSLPNNYDKLLPYISSLDLTLDIIVLTETWLNDLNDRLWDIPTYSHISINRKNKRGGGIRVYYKNIYSIALIKELSGEFETHESLFLTISSGGEKYILGVIYRAPNLCVSNFNNYLEYNLFTNELLLTKKCLILGDFNIDYRLIQRHENFISFCNLMNENGFQMRVTQPTHCDSQSGLPSSILDHVWTNFTSNITANVMNYKITDHLPIIATFDTTNKNEVTQKKFHDFSSNNFNKFRLECTPKYENYKLDTNDVHIETEKFINFNNSLIKKYFPIKTKVISIKRLKMPWITDRILKLITKKHKLFLLLKRHQIPYNVFKAYSSLLNKLIKRVKREYYIQKFETASTDSKETWKLINNILGRKKRSEISELDIEGNIITDEKQLAENFVDFFASIPIDAQSKLKNPIENFDNIIPVNNSSIYLRPARSKEILIVINKLSNKSSKNDIPMKIIKSQSASFARVLSLLFIQTATYPDILKRATVIPVHKNGDKKLLKNYRPISTLSNINKIFEKLLYERLSDFFDSTEIISDAQYGFRKSRDTQLASLKLINLILPAFKNTNKFAASVFLDFSKAFDTVDHHLLLKKQNKYGIRGTALELLKSYSSGRTMTVKIRNTNSKIINVTVGVPQGSCLGPLFYLVYANDLQNVVENLSSVVFADDTTIVETSNSVEALALRLNFLLAKIVDWSNFNKLSLNNAKTKWMLFTNKTINIPKLFICGKEIEQVDF